MKPGDEAFWVSFKFPRCDEMKDLPISIDFQTWKHGVVTPVQYYKFLIHHSLFSMTTTPTWEQPIKVQMFVLFTQNRTPFTRWLLLKLQKSTFKKICRKIYIRKQPLRELIWKRMLSKSGQNSWKMRMKEPTLQQSFRLEAVLNLSPVTAISQGFCYGPE